MSLMIELVGEEVALLPERGLFWARGSVLMIADWHVGKAASLRAAGMGIPDGDLDEEFVRLETMLAQTSATELMILGDFAHARDGLTPELLETVCKWISRSGIKVSLVTGNHDRSAGIGPRVVDGMEVLGDSVTRPPFVLRHEPGASADGYVLAGHLHPAVRLGEGKVGGLRAPCFWFGNEGGVLPAFGGFTGGQRVSPARGDRVFALGGGEVFEIA